MLNLLLNDKFIKKLAAKLTRQVQTNITKIHTKQDQKLDLILGSIERLHTDMKLMEDRLTKKEITDRMEQGQLKYKIASLESDIRPKRSRREVSGSH